MPPLPLKMVQNTSRWCRIPSIPASIGWFLTVLCLRIGQKVFLRWFAKFKKVLKKGVFKGFLAPAPEEFMGVWIWGIFFLHQSATMTSDLLPRACQLSGGYFFENNSDFFGRVGGGGGGASFRQGLLTGACGFQRRFVRIRLVSHNSDEVPESKFGRRKCSVVGTFEVI